MFAGGLIVYTNDAKHEVAGVPREVLETHGAVSAETAGALAEGAADRLHADLGLGVTGVAGPSEQEGKPVGTVYVAAAFAGRTEVRHVTGYGDRTNIRMVAVTAALDLGRRVLLRS